MIILITRPDHDFSTRYISAWSTKIIELATKKNHKVIDLKGKKVTKKGVVGRIKKLKPSVVFLNGHGDAVSYLCYRRISYLIPGYELL